MRATAVYGLCWLERGPLRAIEAAVSRTRTYQNVSVRVGSVGELVTDFWRSCFLLAYVHSWYNENSSNPWFSSLSFVFSLLFCRFRTTGETPGWDSLAGYSKVKQEIEDTLVLPLRHPVSGD